MYVNARSVEAERVLKRLAEADPKGLGTEEARVKWAGARLAWMALARLQGRDEEALRIFGACGEWCEKYGPAEEWKTARTWACARQATLKPCGKVGSNKDK